MLSLTVTYAPPGSASSVTYSNSTMLGTSSMVSNSFTNDVKVTASIDRRVLPFWAVQDCITAFDSYAQLTQETDTSSSVALTRRPT